jgi:CRISPR-associated protein Cas5d
MVSAARLPGSPLSVKVWGPWACFTRPEYGTERVSYPVMTPSAAIGILESVFWKPEIRWRPRAIDVLKPIRWMHLMRNELDDRQTIDRARGWAADGLGHFDAAGRRDQRNTLLLRDVAYVIHADVEVVAGSGADDVKYRDQFRRRVRRGQHFAQPYLGCREFLAYVGEPEEGDQPIELDIDLGRMLAAIERDPVGRMISADFAMSHLVGGRLVVVGEVGA